MEKQKKGHDLIFVVSFEAEAWNKWSAWLPSNKP